MNSLPYGINLVFEEDCKHFWLYCPYNRQFIEALGWNMIDRKWDKTREAYRISTEFFEDVYGLIDQYFGAWSRVPVFGYLEALEPTREGDR